MSRFDTNPSELMKGALQILERALSSLVDAAKPGVTPRELAARAEAIIAASGARAVLPNERNDGGDRFGFAACVCVNDAAANAVPSMVPLAPGDLVTLDIALAWPGSEVGGRRAAAQAAVVDGATTCVVFGVGPGEPAFAKAINLRDAARAATGACLAAAQPGATPDVLHEVAAAVAARFGVGLASIPLVHRVNQGPGALHVALPERLPLQPGDIIAIEPLLVEGPGGALVLEPDAFTLRTGDASLAAYEECTMVVGDDEATPRVLPSAALRPWLIP